MTQQTSTDIETVNIEDSDPIPLDWVSHWDDPIGTLDWWEKFENVDKAIEMIKSINDAKIGMPAVIYVNELMEVPNISTSYCIMQHNVFGFGALHEIWLGDVKETRKNEEFLDVDWTDRDEAMRNFPFVFISLLNEDMIAKSSLTYFHAVFIWNGEHFQCPFYPERKLTWETVHWLKEKRSVEISPDCALESYVLEQLEKEGSNHVALQKLPTG